MKIKIDPILAVEFGRAVPRSDQVRYYYVIGNYPDVVLVTWERTLLEWVGREAILLVNTDEVDGWIICEKFSKAPARWRDAEIGELAQITIRPLDGWRNPPPGPPQLLSVAIKEIFGDIES